MNRPAERESGEVRRFSREAYFYERCSSINVLVDRILQISPKVSHRHEPSTPFRQISLGEITVGPTLHILTLFLLISSTGVHRVLLFMVALRASEKESVGKGELACAHHMECIRDVLSSHQPDISRNQAQGYSYARTVPVFETID